MMKTKLVQLIKIIIVCQHNNNNNKTLIRENELHTILKSYGLF